MNPMIYVPLTPDTAALRKHLGEPHAQYFGPGGKKVGEHWRVSPVAVSTLQKQFGKVFEVVK